MQPNQEESLTIKRIFHARRERVFEAFSDPRVLASWWGPHGIVASDVSIDLRPGGKYRINMHFPDKPDFFAEGEYREIVPPEKLVFTWTWGGPEMEALAGIEMLITILFHERGEETEMEFIHERIPNALVASSHNEGWISSFDALERFLAL